MARFFRMDCPHCSTGKLKRIGHKIIWGTKVIVYKCDKCKKLWEE